MALDKYNFTKGTEFSAYAPIRKAWDVTPSETLMEERTRAIMVSEAATVTGILAGQSDSHTTFELQPGILYPFMFEVISAVSAGTVKAYA